MTETRRAVHWAGIGEAGALWGLRLMAATYRRTGRRPFRLLLGPVLAYFFAVRGVARRASREYLRRVEGPDGWLAEQRRSFRHFRAFGECLLDKLLAWSGGLEYDRVTALGTEPLAAHLAAGRGGLMIVAHLGNLELSRVLAQRQPGLRLTILTHTAHAPRFNRLLAAHDPASQAGLLQVGEITAATAVLLEERVSRGEWVAVAGDRVPPGPAGRAVGAPFLGREAPFPVGPYILADLLRCPVMLLFCLRLADGYRLVLEPFADRLSLPRVGREALLGAAAARFAGRLEHHCRQAPLQWFNFFPFWDAPTGASGREPLAGARGSRHV